MWGKKISVEDKCPRGDLCFLSVFTVVSPLHKPLSIACRRDAKGYKPHLGENRVIISGIKHFIITIGNIYLIMQPWSWFSFQTMGKKQETPKLTLARNLILSPNNSSNTGAKSNKENLCADLVSISSKSSVKPWAGNCTTLQRKTQELANMMEWDRLWVESLSVWRNGQSVLV